MLGATFADPWRFQANPEVYVLVAFLIAAYVYSIRVIGPRAVGAGEQVVTRTNVGCFAGAMTLQFAASTWPIHQIGEDYLYWCMRADASYLCHHWCCWPHRMVLAPGRNRAHGAPVHDQPVVAAVVFNVVVMVTTSPGRQCRCRAPLHLAAPALVLTALLMWMPVVGRSRAAHERCRQADLPVLAERCATVPAGWLTFRGRRAHYNQPVRVGYQPTDDQQLAGAS
jgi:putative membrane protein